MEAKDFRFEDIQVGQAASFKVLITEKDVEQFALLSGDHNPLHMSNEYAETTSFNKKVVHGMLLGAYVSRLVGMELPGKRCLFLNESLTFKRPVFIGDQIEVKGVVISKSEVTRVLGLAITIMCGEEVKVEGRVNVQVS